MDGVIQCCDGARDIITTNLNPRSGYARRPHTPVVPLPNNTIDIRQSSSSSSSSISFVYGQSGYSVSTEGFYKLWPPNWKQFGTAPELTTVHELSSESEEFKAVSAMCGQFKEKILFIKKIQNLGHVYIWNKATEGDEMKLFFMPWSTDEIHHFVENGLTVKSSTKALWKYGYGIYLSKSIGARVLEDIRRTKQCSWGDGNTWNLR